ncbi:Zinc finger CCCH domain-containing protein [Actinidia chinensis var. chinensis]|uniref:Zinc finger CCCH domain-containing protein n=1 Tax=Actinidia chinensis var. chinensis TaxID=1590841 RepID=A0A2R6RSV9_ACTCC|nr:Zinc finger CCCH domain-containing protein [Actinidia chinensis var. chinensis]
MDLEGNKRVFHRLGPSSDDRNQKVCYHWRAGKCDRFPCPYLHRELPQQAKNGTASSKRPLGFSDDQQVGRRNPNFGNNSSSWGRTYGGRGRGGGGGGGEIVKKTEKLCNYWVQENCTYGDRCRYLHSWSTGGFSMLTQLEGHQEVVSGIAMPSGSDKLYTGSKDKTVRVWDCQSGQCAGVINLGGEVGCMLSEGPWVFVGLPNVVKAWNIQTTADLSLSGPVGQVYTLVVGNDLLFAGTQDGTILAWRFNAATNCFDPAATLKSHTLAVVTLVVGANRLYSGSVDNSIRVWSLETLQCIQTLSEHSSVVMSVLCWDQFLLSCSLDKTIKVWVATESGNLEVTYTHNEEHGLLTLCGMHDSEAKPVLLCSCNDNSVRAYDLPSFLERGKIFAKQEVRSIQIGPGGLFFTGDGTGKVRVWNWLAEPTATA